MKYVTNLQQVLKENKKELSALEQLVKFCLYDPDETTREEAINALALNFLGRYIKLRGCFEGDKQIFIKLKIGDGEPEIFYLCEAPKQYYNFPAIAQPFEYR